MNCLKDGGGWGWQTAIIGKGGWKSGGKISGEENAAGRGYFWRDIDFGGEVEWLALNGTNS